MPAEFRWRYALMEQAEIQPFIAYRGYPPDWAHDTLQTVSGYTWWEVVRGGVEVRTVFGSTHAAQGNWILVPHGLQRRQLLQRGTMLTSLSFQAVWPNGRPIVELEKPVTGPAGTEVTRLARATCDIAGRAVGPAAFTAREFSFMEWLQVRCSFLTFIAQLMENVTAPGIGGRIAGPLSGDTRLDIIVHDIRQNLNAGPLPYSAWSQRLGLARAQIDRLAARHLGGTLRARRDVLLRDEIRHQLAMGTLSAKELAAKYSFTDAAHFSRWVRRMTGHTPTELRVAAV
ncbi:MAG: helix-turn-helix domain-containing protein [Candidatus Methylacidiphilales bacterium]